MSNKTHEYHVIGKGSPRIDAADQVTGKATYLPDLIRSGMLHGAFARSPIPHGRILNVDTSRAKKLPGVKAVLTGPDTPEARHGYQLTIANKRPLVVNKVRFIGDEIAAVAATSEEIAREACSLIKVDFEPLPAVFDPKEAMAEGAPVIHEDMPGNVAAELNKDLGDVEAGFAASAHIFEEAYETPAWAHCCMETRGALAETDGQGRITLWACTQFPHILREILSKVMKIPTRNIRVIKVKMGGGFGSRQSMDSIDPVAIYLAQKTDRPVRMIKNREEEFTTDRISYPMAARLKTGVSDRGELIARHIELTTDTGAYNDQGLYITSSAGSKVTGLYRVPNVRIDGKVVFTNKLWGGAFRGYGNQQATFAIESQMDQIAEKLGMDPLELRLLNANRQGESTASGARLISCGFTECLEQSTDAAGWKKKKARIKPVGATKVRGVGMASVFHTGGGSIGSHGSSFSSAVVKIDSSGSIDVLTGVPDIGQGSDTIYAMIAAEALGAKLEDVRVHSADTEVTPYTLGVRGSRETFIAGNAVKMAAENARKDLIDRAGEILDVDPQYIDAANGKVFVTFNPEECATIADVVGKPMHAQFGTFPVGPPIVASAVYKDPVSRFSKEKTGYGNFCPCYVYGTQVAEVEVDTETGNVKVLEVIAAIDVGKALNPTAVEGQFEGSIYMGIGFALTEGIVWENGRVLNSHFTDYKVMTAPDMPKIKSIMVETHDPFGPFGAKGLGEAAIVPTVAAVANAIYDAVGIRFNELPITPEKLLFAIKARKQHTPEVAMR